MPVTTNRTEYQKLYRLSKIYKKPADQLNPTVVKLLSLTDKSHVYHILEKSLTMKSELSEATSKINLIKSKLPDKLFELLVDPTKSRDDVEQYICSMAGV